jgi:hypothetical protein
MDISKYINIKAPKTINDLRIKHLNALTDPKFQNDLNLELMIDFVASITNAKRSDLRNVYSDKIKEVFTHCVDLFKGFKLGKPSEQIIVAGQLFDLVNPSKVGVGWHIDVSNSDFKAQPSRLVALMYIEHGTVYGELDENKNMKYPAKYRMDLFEEHLPLPTYLNCVDFFLRQSLKSMSSSMERRMPIMRMIQNGKRLMFGNN